MSDAEPSKRLSRGKRWWQWRTGQPVGRPLAEWAYVTPRFLTGVTASDLARATENLQRETALFWFLSNMEPYDLSRGGPYFGFSGTDVGVGFNQGVFAPPQLNAFQVLRDEFGEFLPVDVLHRLGESLKGNWMWKPPEHAPSSAQPQETLLAEIIELLDSLDSRFRRLFPSPGQIGHNNPPDDDPSIQLPITREDQDKALQAIAETKAILSVGGEPDQHKLKAAWSKVTPYADRFGGWVLRLGGVFFSNLVEESAKSMGKVVGPLMLYAVAGPSIWSDILHITELLEKLFK